MVQDETQTSELTSLVSRSHVVAVLPASSSAQSGHCPADTFTVDMAFAFPCPNGKVRVYFPIATSIVLSLMLSLILRWFG